jgi:hypothetical protein
MTFVSWVNVNLRVNNLLKTLVSCTGVVEKLQHLQLLRRMQPEPQLPLNYTY